MKNVTLLYENEISKNCKLSINETFVDDAEHINIAMPMYNLIEYSNNYSDTSGSLWWFKRDEQPIDNNGAFINLTAENSSSFKYESNFIGDTVVDGSANREKECAKIAKPLKCLSNFWRFLEMPLIHCKVEFSLKWYGNCILSSSGNAATFTITDAKLYVRIVTLKTKGNTKLSKLFTPIYWNYYKLILNKNYNAMNT